MTRSADILTDDAARAIAEGATGRKAFSTVRAVDGQANMVAIVTVEDRQVVVRANATPYSLAGTEKNLAILAALEIPVPSILASDLTMTKWPFGWVVLTYFPGRDLRHELVNMDADLQQDLANQVVDAQRRASTLPAGVAYGFTHINGRAAHGSWNAVVTNEQADSTQDADDVEELAALAAPQRAHMRPYFEGVTPTCFLDDITVKNVIIENGRLSGFVDFDSVCYGDPMFHVGLTAAGIVCDISAASLTYAVALLNCWDATDEQAAAATLYAALFGLNFLRRYSDDESPEWRVRMLHAVRGWLENPARHFG